MKGEASVEAGGNWEERESGAARGLLKAGSGGTLGREVETEGELIVPGRGSEVDRPEKQRETSNQRAFPLLICLPFSHSAGLYILSSAL